MPLGLYLSVPFCRSKCTYCNFASGVFSEPIFERYVDRLCRDIERAQKTAAETGGELAPYVDSVYLGGGTPTILEVKELKRLFVTISKTFQIAGDAEITVECAPGVLQGPVLEALQHCGVNRVSLGVQSFVDREAASVGRLHNRAMIIADLRRLRNAGIFNINLDLIAGLPHQTLASWNFSVAEAIDAGAPHVSVYMLEVDDDSRLGRELIAGGTRYHAHFVPDDDLVTDFYQIACQRLEQSDIEQYEISNFSRQGRESRHNLKYWQRLPYLGFGVDAHSMLPSPSSQYNAVRFATPNSLERYLEGGATTVTPVSQASALEEEFFLGLRLNRGVDLQRLADIYGPESLHGMRETITRLSDDGLLLADPHAIRLNQRGRLLSNEVFQAFIASNEPARAAEVGL